jgi:hypothetical protein
MRLVRRKISATGLSWAMIAKFKFSHFPGVKRLRIQVHSRKKPDVVLFSVVRLTSRDETNLLRFKHLQSALQFSTGLAVEISGTWSPGPLAAGVNGWS